MTGYTYEIKDNKVKSLKDFALLCCRNFGIFAEYRDEPIDKIIEKVEVNQYYIDAVEKAQKEWDDFSKDKEKRTYEEAEQAFNENLVKTFRSYENDYEENKLFVDKCKSLLKEAEEWKVPSEEYLKLKDFMIDQLQSTINFDEFTKEDLDRLIQREKDSKENFINNYINGTDLKYKLEEKKKSLEKVKKRVEKNNEWLDTLKNSFN